VRHVARQLSVVVVHSPETRLLGARRVLEDVFNAELDVGKHTLVGDACACIIDVRVPDSFVFHAAKRRIGEELPDVRIKMMDRLTEPRWARPQWHVGVGIAIGIIAGIALSFIDELLSPLVTRMREALG